MEHLPPWLRNLPLPPRPSPGPGPADTTPDWLREIEQPAPPPMSPSAPTAAAAAPADNTPDWLRELQSEVEEPPRPQAPPPQPGPAGESGDVPDWLRDLEQSQGTDAPGGSRPTPFGATSWLSGLGQDSAGPTAPAEPPQEPPPTTTTSRIRMPVGATDWLRSIGQEPDMDEVLDQAERERDAAPSPAEGDDDRSGVPDWLRDVTPEEIESAAAAEPPEPAPASQQFPAWLRDDPATSDASTISSDWGEAASAETVPADDMPDWLRDVVPDDPAPGRRAQATAPDWLSDDAPASSDVPAWLRDVAGDAPPADSPSWLDQVAPEPSPAPRAEDVPAWLREAEEEPPAASPADDVPAWLHDAEERPSAPQPPAPSPADDVPAWLRDAEQAPAALPPQPEPAEPDEVPAWLRDIEQPPAAPPPPEPPTWLREAAAAEPPPAGDIPPWLQDQPAEPPAAPPPTWLRSALDDQQPAPPAPAPAARPTPPDPAQDLPAWLSGDEPSPGAPSPAAAGDMALPSWLRGVADEPLDARPSPAPPRPGRPEEPRRAAPVDAEGDDFLRGAELPSWLRVPEPERPAETVEGQALDWLSRLGAPEQEEEGESSGPAVATERLPRRPIYQSSAEQIAATALLSRLVRSPYPEPAPLPAPAIPTRWQRIGLDRVLYLLLILILLVGVAVPQISSPFQALGPTPANVGELSSLVDGLDAEDVVLVAYEWGAQRSAELRPLEQALTARLIERRAKLILVSTDLQGTLLSFDLREPLRAAGYNVEPDGRDFGGRDYVQLGYRPGGELALRQFARDLRGELRSDFTGQDATESLVANRADGSPRFSSIADLAMIVVMADQPQDVQAWMEQVHRAAPGVPIAFLLPQEAEPLVQPYMTLPNVYHLAGRQGALAFAATGPAPDTAAIAGASGQQGLAVVVFLILLLAGALVAGLSRARQPRGGAA